MIKYICDKCKSEIYPFNNFELAINEPIASNPEKLLSYKKVLLCTDCIKAFKLFLDDDTKIYEIR